MKNSLKWFIGIALVLVVLFALPFAYRLAFPAAGYGYSMMGGRFGGFGSGLVHPMMGGFSFMPFGFFGMGWIPLLVLGLLAFGIYTLAKNTKTSAPAVGRVCPACGQPAQPGWNNCPHCGTTL